MYVRDPKFGLAELRTCTDLADGVHLSFAVHKELDNVVVAMDSSLTKGSHLHGVGVPFKNQLLNLVQRMEKENA